MSLHRSWCSNFSCQINYHLNHRRETGAVHAGIVRIKKCGAFPLLKIPLYLLRAVAQVLQHEVAADVGIRGDGHRLPSVPVA